MQPLDEVLTRSVATGTSSYLADALGSTVALADNAGVIQSQYNYEPFGQTTVSGAVNTNPVQYTGRENDATGLYYYRSRYYNATIQRFISEDPLALGGGDTNLYVYAGSGPTDFTDPFGLQRYDAANNGPPQPKTQKVTAGCMGARLLENFFGSTGYPTLTVALNVATVAVLKPAVATLVPGPGWLYTTTAVGYDLYMVGKSYTDCKYGVPESNPPGEIE